MNDIKFLPGVGPKRAELFNKELGIYSYEDLLYYYPYKDIDRSRTYTIREINETMPYIQLRGKIVRYETQGEGYKRRLTAIFADATGTIELVWFKGIKYIQDRYKPGTEYTLFGRPTLFGSRLNIARSRRCGNRRKHRLATVLYDDREDEVAFSQFEGGAENHRYVVESHSPFSSRDASGGRNRPGSCDLSQRSAL